MKQLLVTAFEPFGGEAMNPTESILAALPESVAGAALSKMTLPVVYRESAEILCARIGALRPDAVVMLGQAGGRAKITPERIAINLDHAELSDNAGERRRNVHIRPDAPAAYFTTLPVDAMLQAMEEQGIPSALSVSAGAFLCNHTLFEALHHIHVHGLDIPAGFIHVPYLPEQTKEKPAMPSMPLADMVKGVYAALLAAVSQIAE